MRYLIVFVIFATVVFGVFFLLKNIRQKNKILLPSPANQVLGLELKNNNEGAVEIKIEPLNINSDAIIWNFRITMTTHSVELNNDLLEDALLIDNDGREYKPIAWDGPLPGGHHLTGELKFQAPLKLPASIKLVLRNIGQIKERQFVWSL